MKKSIWVDRPFFLAVLLGTGLFSCAQKTTGETVVTNADTASWSDVDIAAPPTNDQSGSVVFELNYTGVVRDMSKHEGCGFMIELDAGNGEKILLEPLTLDQSYQVDGKSITFTYTDSRRPSQCSLPSKPIVIDKILN